jgi:hypothetical protein
MSPETETLLWCSPTAGAPASLVATKAGKTCRNWPNPPQARCRQSVGGKLSLAAFGWVLPGCPVDDDAHFLDFCSADHASRITRRSMDRRVSSGGLVPCAPRAKARASAPEAALYGLCGSAPNTPKPQSSGAIIGDVMVRQPSPVLLAPHVAKRCIGTYLITLLPSPTSEHQALDTLQRFLLLLLISRLAISSLPSPQTDPVLLWRCATL